MQAVRAWAAVVNSPMRFLRLLCLSLLSACIGIAPVQASGRQDHEVARRALEAGEILSLRQVLERIEHEHRGEILEVELEFENQRWIYEVKLLRRDGGINKLIIDARDGRVLEVKRRHGGRHGRRD